MPYLEHPTQGAAIEAMVLAGQAAYAAGRSTPGNPERWHRAAIVLLRDPGAGPADARAAYMAGDGSGWIDWPSLSPARRRRWELVTAAMRSAEVSA